MRKMTKSFTFLNLEGLSANESAANEQKGSSSGRWPNWAKAFSLLGLCLILLFFVDIPVQRSHSSEVLLDNQQWELSQSRVGVYWKVSLQSNDNLSINLRVSEKILQVVFYISDENGTRLVNYTTNELFLNWRAPMLGQFSINIDNPYIQEETEGTISVIRYMATPEYRTDYPYRWLQVGLLIIGVVLMTLGLSALPRFSRTPSTAGGPQT
jgi:hypothetical protein